MRPAHRRLPPFRALIFALPLLLPVLASAQVMREVASPFAAQAKVDERLFLRRPGTEGTWRARVDAATGDLLELSDINDYAKVTGGIYPVSPAVGPEVDRPLPVANVSPLAICANDSGAYNWTSGVTSSTLNGCQVRISDACGAISQASGLNGNIAFGTSAGTN